MACERAAKNLANLVGLLQVNLNGHATQGNQDVWKKKKMMAISHQIRKVQRKIKFFFPMTKKSRVFLSNGEREDLKKLFILATSPCSATAGVFSDEHKNKVSSRRRRKLNAMLKMKCYPRTQVFGWTLFNHFNM